MEDVLIKHAPGSQLFIGRTPDPDYMKPLQNHKGGRAKPKGGTVDVDPCPQQYLRLRLGPLLLYVPRAGHIRLDLVDTPAEYRLQGPGDR